LADLTLRSLVMSGEGQQRSARTVKCSPTANSVNRAFRRTSGGQGGADKREIALNEKTTSRNKKKGVSGFRRKSARVAQLNQEGRRVSWARYSIRQRAELENKGGGNQGASEVQPGGKAGKRAKARLERKEKKVI